MSYEYNDTNLGDPRDTADEKEIARLEGKLRKARADIAELERQRDAALAAVKAANRLLDDSYVSWHSAGGVNDCAHGYGEGIACPKCDKETVRAALDRARKPLSPENQQSENTNT